MQFVDFVLGASPGGCGPGEWSKNMPGLHRIHCDRVLSLLSDSNQRLPDSQTAATAKTANYEQRPRSLI